MITLPTQITKKCSASVSQTVDWRLITNLTICFIALFLCDRFGQAKDMVLKTSEYYTQLTSTISPAAQKKWEQEIKSAESRRLEHPHAMDIISAQQVPIDAKSGSDSNSPTGVTSRWLDLALSIEERQYVYPCIECLLSSDIVK